MALCIFQLLWENLPIPISEYWAAHPPERVGQIKAEQMQLAIFRKIWLDCTSCWENLPFPISEYWAAGHPPKRVGQINAERAKFQLKTAPLSTFTFCSFIFLNLFRHTSVAEYIWLLLLLCSSSEMKRVAFRPGDTVLKSQPFAFVIIASHR